MTKIILLLSLGLTFSCQQPMSFGQNNINTNASVEVEDEVDNEDAQDGGTDFMDKDMFKIKDKESIHNEYDFSNQQKLKIYNVSGSIRIASHEGSKAVVDIEKTIYAKSQEVLDIAKNKVKLGADQADGLVLYTAQPYDTRPKTQGGSHQWNTDEQHYWVHLDYTIKIPRNTSVVASTVNDGDIEIKNIDGEISVNNVNGNIALHQVQKTNHVATVNGDITVEYSAAQAMDCRYSTINGNINIEAPENTSAEMEFKSMNGEFFTDFENYEPLSKVHKVLDKSHGSQTYKLQKVDGIKIGNGASKMKFETLNGDVFIKKSK